MNRKHSFQRASRCHRFYQSCIKANFLAFCKRLLTSGQPTALARKWCKNTNTKIQDRNTETKMDFFKIVSSNLDKTKSTKLTNYVMAQITCSIHWFPINFSWSHPWSTHHQTSWMHPAKRTWLWLWCSEGMVTIMRIRIGVMNSSNHSYPHPSRSDCWSLDPNTSSLSISAMASTHSITLAISLSSFPLFFSFLVRSVERKAHLIPTCKVYAVASTIHIQSDALQHAVSFFLFLQLYSL